MERMAMYLDTLTKIQASGHKVDREIEEALRELRVEAGFEERDKVISKEAEEKAKTTVYRLLRIAVKKEVITSEQRDKIDNLMFDEVFSTIDG